jgi:outer membrane protein assembly factor BamD (BamD/ComL family)
MIQSINNNVKMLLRGFIGPARFTLAVTLALAVTWLALNPGVSAAAEAKKQEISRVIAKEMTAAQKALQAQQWQEALKNLEAAETKSPLTAFDKKTIYDFKGVANVKLNNLKAAQGEFEKALATGAASPEEVASMTRTLFGIAASTQQYQKTIDYGKQLVDAGTATPDNMTIIAQSYYLLKDCKDSIAWADKAIAATRKAGETPKENLFLFKLQCASDAGDTPAMDAVLIDLIKLNNKTSYWNTLLRIERQDERDDHNTLMIYRVMYNTNSMNADTDYIEMAQLLGDAALPGEAAAVLDKAMSTGVIKDDHKERTTRLLNSLKTRADADKKGLAQEDAEATKSAAGELDVKLGEVYYGFGDYQKVVDAITRGLQKGQIKHMDEAYVYLGLAYVQLKNTAEAKKAFQNLKNVPNISPRVLKLWELYAATLGMGAG